MERKIRRMAHGAWRIAIFCAMLYALCSLPAATAQDKGKLDGTIYLANDQTVAMNANVIKYLTDNIGRIASVGGKTTYLVPIQKEFKKRIRTRIVDGYWVQYAYTGIDVSLQKPKTKYIEFDFKTKKIKEVSKNDDNDDPAKPSDTKLKDDVKQKDDKDKVKPGAVKPK